MSKFAVTLNYHGNYGYVEYDSENKKAEIVLGVAEAKAKVEKFLNEKLTLGTAVRKDRRRRHPGTSRQAACHQEGKRSRHL